MPNYYFTESRLVPLYQNPYENPLDKGAKKVNLTPQAKVETAGNEDAYNVVTMAYVKVTVIEGCPFAANEKWWEGDRPSGYILRKNLRKCLKKDAPSIKTGERFTGVSYGDYKFSELEDSKTPTRFANFKPKTVLVITSEANVEKATGSGADFVIQPQQVTQFPKAQLDSYEVAIATKDVMKELRGARQVSAVVQNVEDLVSMVKRLKVLPISPRVQNPQIKIGYQCQLCGRLTADHRLYETEYLRTLAKEFIAAHRIEVHNQLDKMPMMLGILDVREGAGDGKREIVIAESGFDFLCESTMEKQAALFKGVKHHYVTQDNIKQMNDCYLDCEGQKLGEQPTNKFSCAAPKMVQYFAHVLRTDYRAPILYMTEVAAKSFGIFVADHTAESCGTCRTIIPAMLCGLTSLERQAVNGVYPKRQR